MGAILDLWLIKDEDPCELVQLGNKGESGQVQLAYKALSAARRYDLALDHRDQRPRSAGICGPRERAPPTVKN